MDGLNDVFPLRIRDHFIKPDLQLLARDEGLNILRSHCEQFVARIACLRACRLIEIDESHLGPVDKECRIGRCVQRRAEPFDLLIPSGDLSLVLSREDSDEQSGKDGQYKSGHGVDLDGILHLGAAPRGPFARDLGEFVRRDDKMT